MRRRLPILLPAVMALLLLLVLGTYLYDRGHRDVIAKGVSIDGVDVGGLHSAAARARVRAVLVAPLHRTIVVSDGTHSWQIDSRQAQVTVATDALVADALKLSRQGSIVTRTLRNLTGGSVQRNLPLQISYSHAAVRGLDAQIRSALDRPAHPASVVPSASGLQQVPSAPGVAVDSTKLGAGVELALTDPATPSKVVVPTVPVAPAVTTDQLAAQYPAYIVVDRAGFQLRLYQHLQLTRTYPIAVGMQGLQTPPGLYHIQWKQVNPPWYVPNSAWAGALRGKTIPPGPQDPLKARFMSFDGSAGIHGIDPSEYGTIGHDASHGCVRMRIPDVIDLYAKSPVGTPVFIG